MNVYLITSLDPRDHDDPPLSVYVMGDSVEDALARWRADLEKREINHRIDPTCMTRLGRLVI